MTWPSYVTLQFELVNKFTTEESNYYGPFITLLTELFPASEDYQVALQFKHVVGHVSTVPTPHVITRHGLPVVFIEFKPQVAYDKDLVCKEVDDQMHERFLNFTGSIPIPMFYGLSVLGTRFCIYKYSVANRSVTPPCIPPSDNFIVNVAPKERWDFDLLEVDRKARLKELVAHIKAMVAALQ
ncbi:uncharacterized protein EI90DRAFT_3223863 [Cantharellus anzutake]|uniref:uncharacterized protein n=1 Tax=Cantharellus anzutake TaxID=1750568 RepID=UPI001902F6F6|nr:uncharacterized protein EI90DRAFT_3223863 [Cantharellus anzutake]KAF8327617.1 hypothetical protein EI90DRAFT_3223863 [Cantharellus anzutake]